MNAPHLPADLFDYRPWPRVLQWLCGVFSGHDAVNYSDSSIHYAYCFRCGRLFGQPWGGDR